jgi:hypothetical protein
MMHITPAASGYFENMWLWVADHMIEYVHCQYLMGDNTADKRFCSDPDLNDANNTMVSDEEESLPFKPTS